MNISNSKYIKELLDASGLLDLQGKKTNPELNHDFSDEIILITGAAGSIGSEIAMQLSTCSFKKLILLDIAETPLYYLLQELKEHHNLNIDFVLTDIRDESSMKIVFEKHKPSLVFHTAAYKHVPLMEDNPYEAVRLNVFATKLLADLSVLYNTKRFVFISTDKAVDPISVMGFTKRIAERYLEQLKNSTNTAFLITRFGNVFGSNGSIVPLFLNQIKTGIPLTITSKKATRYFISKNKACRLILKIAALEKASFGIFTFNMGKPIKIIDLAKIIISHYENTTSNQIAMKITGLRPGEKLHESIVSKNEILEATVCDAILLVKPKDHFKEKHINLEVLKNITPNKKPSEIKYVLKSFIKD